MKSRASLSWLFALGLALAGCAKSNDLQVGGETNWLKVCTDETGCGKGSCVCGVCTTVCDAASRCRGDFAGSCVSTTSQLGASACAGVEQVPVGLCLPGCNSDAECGTGLSCRDAVCVSERIAERFDAMQEASGEPDAQRQTEQDAGTCRVADSCELGVMCDWATARARVPECARPLGGSRLARCAAYDSVVSTGIDSSITYYFGADGALVGTNSGGLTSEPGCVSYDPSFTLPLSCMQTTPPCSDDAGTDDAGPRDASAMVCDCGRAEVSLECVCAQGPLACRSFEQVTADVLCVDGSSSMNSLQRGCGYKQVVLGGGLGSRRYVYQGAGNALVGAELIDDLPHGSCARNEYRTQIPDLQTCADYTVCDLCPGAANACQL